MAAGQTGLQSSSAGLGAGASGTGGSEREYSALHRASKLAAQFPTLNLAFCASQVPTWLRPPPPPTCRPPFAQSAAPQICAGAPPWSCWPPAFPRSAPAWPWRPDGSGGRSVAAVCCRAPTASWRQQQGAEIAQASHGGQGASTACGAACAGGKIAGEPLPHQFLPNKPQSTALPLLPMCIPMPPFRCEA